MTTRKSAEELAREAGLFLVDLEALGRLIALVRAEERAALDAAEATVSKYESELSAVMPADFKDWHQNSKAEWPEVAAWVIRNLREHRDAAEADARRYNHLRDADMDERNRLEHYAGGELDVAIDAALAKE